MKNQNEEKTKTALVTGGAKRIGKAIALSLAKQGFNVWIQFRHSLTAAEETVTELKNLGVKAGKIYGNLDRPSDAEILFDKLRQEKEVINILINNASIFPQDRLMEMSFQNLDRTMNTNTYVPLELARLFANQCQEGNIINLLDTRIYSIDLNHATYQLSKKVLSYLTQMLAVELAPHIRVNAIAPGVILAPSGKDNQFLTKMAKKNLLQKIGTTDHIANTALYLINNTFITGETIFVDGGQSLRRLVFDV